MTAGASNQIERRLGNSARARSGQGDGGDGHAQVGYSQRIKGADGATSFPSRPIDRYQKDVIEGRLEALVLLVDNAPVQRGSRRKGPGSLRRNRRLFYQTQRIDRVEASAGNWNSMPGGHRLLVGNCALRPRTDRKCHHPEEAPCEGENHEDADAQQDDPPGPFGATLRAGAGRSRGSAATSREAVTPERVTTTRNWRSRDGLISRRRHTEARPSNRAG